MRTFLFMDAVTTGLDTNEDRIVQLSTRLVTPEGFQDYNHLVRPICFTIPDTVTSVHGLTDQVATRKKISLERALADLTQQIEQSDILIGHRIDFVLAVLLAEARRIGQSDLVAMLTPPSFGFDGGRRAGICTQCLAADYFRFLGESPSLADAKLATINRRLLREELVDASNGMINVISCQRVYDHLRAFQVEHELSFPADIICFEN